MKYIISSILISLSVFSCALADAKAELNVSPNGDIHFVGANLLRKHASNLYTIETWGFRWLTNLPYGTKLESAYGETIKPEDTKEGDLLDVTGKFFLQDFVYQIETTHIKDLSIKTGTPPAPAPLPPPVVALPPTPTPPPPAPKPTATPALTISLKSGYRGGQVTILQKFLKKRSLLDSDSVTGVFGKATEDALKKFQEANALEASGTLGPKTRTLINSLLLK